jgi:ABC-type multidrug transport system fused ATPase/permease subunit
MSLLRLNELTSGRIIIDGQDISNISRSTVRQSISSLSQDPFFFPGSIRQNADPWDCATSTEILDALQRVGIWDSLATKIEGTVDDVLETKLDHGILSQGQKQLFCLARALLKRSKVLILDEPTSRYAGPFLTSQYNTVCCKLSGILMKFDSLDRETDVKVQQVIRESFKECTVMMIAHRIRTLLDFDQIIVLDSGRIIEQGSPSQLIGRDGGEFSKLLGLES